MPRPTSHLLTVPSRPKRAHRTLKLVGVVHREHATRTNMATAPGFVGLTEIVDWLVDPKAASNRSAQEIR